MSLQVNFTVFSFAQLLRGLNMKIHHVFSIFRQQQVSFMKVIDMRYQCFALVILFSESVTDKKEMATLRERDYRWTIMNFLRLCSFLEYFFFVNQR